MLKVKVNLYIYRRKAYRGMEVLFHTFLTSALGGGEFSASRSVHITLGKKVASYIE